MSAPDVANVVEFVATDDSSAAPIINMAHLIGVRERLGALLFSLVCWLYFLVPVAVLGGWLAGYRRLAREVVELGGWRRFQHLMEVSGQTILYLAAAWIAWTVYLLVQRNRPVPAPPMVDDATLCGFFGIEPGELGRYRGSRLLTIHFEDDGRYRQLVPEDGGLAVDAVTANIEAEGTAFPLAKTG